MIKNLLITCLALAMICGDASGEDSAETGLASETPEAIATDMPFADATRSLDPVDEASPTGEVMEVQSGPINAWHSRWSSNVISAANYIDTFFADARLDEESNETRIKLSLGVYASEVDDVKVVNKFHLRLHLPGTSKRLQLVFDDLVESDDPNNANDVLTDINDSTPDVALRYNLRKKKNYKLDADLGVRLGGSNPLFVRVRGERRINVTEKTKLRLTQSVRWLSEDGWVSLSQFQVNHQLAWNLLFRSNTELEWPEEQRGVRPAQTFSLFQTLTRRRALRYEIGGNWPESPGPTDTRYFTSISHRRRIHSHWIYLEVKPGVEFLQTEDYDLSLFVTVQFDFIFGDPEK